MKTNRAMLIACALLLCVLLTFFGCRKESYKNDVLPSDITASVEKQLPVQSGYESYDSDFLTFYIPDAPPLVDAYSVIHASAPNDYTEVGILKAKTPENIEALETAVANYMAEFISTYRPQAKQYDPSEEQKLEDATYHVYGQYVIYTIMTSDQQSHCYGIIESILRSNE